MGHRVRPILVIRRTLSLPVPVPLWKRLIFFFGPVFPGGSGLMQFPVSLNSQVHLRQLSAVLVATTPKLRAWNAEEFQVLRRE